MAQRRKPPIVAFCYDFDGTLAPGNMQEHSFLPDMGAEKDAFWAEVQSLAKKHEADNILVYMRHMLDTANHRGRRITRKDFEDHGRNVTLFHGVEDWFPRINARGKELGLNVQHFIISSGIREMVQATKIAKRFTEIFASSFIYDEITGDAVWPALCINYTTKTQYLFRINKGTLDVWDHSRINKFTPREERPVPFRRMVFFGDGETDVPCMRLMVDQGGYAVAVHDPGKKSAQERARSLLDQERAHFVGPGDYSEGRELDRFANGILEEIAAHEALEKLGKPKMSGSGKGDVAGW
jgi:phosphoserine phosphatase